jgi:hypothetical protein
MAEELKKIIIVELQIFLQNSFKSPLLLQGMSVCRGTAFLTPPVVSGRQ